MSEYTDAKNNTYKITNTVLLSGENREETKNKIVEDLYKIFTRK